MVFKMKKFCFKIEENLMKRWEWVTWDGLVMCKGVWLIFSLILLEVVKKKIMSIKEVTKSMILDKIEW